MSRGPVRLATAVAAAVLGLPASAGAVGLGSPGKVATIQPGGPVRVWDPVQAALGGSDGGWTTIAQKAAPGPGELTTSTLTRPQWSPDGTQLVFTESAPDPGDPPPAHAPYEQTSIYLYTVASGAVTRLTTPDPSLVDKNPDDDRDVGHVVSDFAPTFSPDGSTVAFIRSIQATEQDDLAPDAGMQVWTVGTGGGTAARRTNLGRDSVLFMLQWIPGSQQLLTVQGADDGSLHVARVALGGWAAPIAGTAGVTPPSGLDVSPDGTLFSYVSIGDSGFRAHVRPLAGGGDVASFAVNDFPSFSPTGNGILTQGCIADRCGMVEKYAFSAKQPRDIPDGETEQMALAGYAFPEGTAFDVQPQQLPVVFLPGFLGSVIACGSDNLWPGEFATLPEPLEMQLAPDGLTNTGCSGTKATGAPVRRVVHENIYAGVSDYVEEHFGDRGAVLGWDWRKRPQESLLALDAKIDELLARDGLGKRQGVGRVVLWGHSYGGMLIRTYLAKMHPEKVARVLTLGTPYWGSPKAIFPIAFGVETPVEGPGLDLFFDNRELKQLARNLGGLYQLFPSPRFGSWLSVDSRNQPVAKALDDLGGNAVLYGQAQGYHREVYDGFFGNGGRIDVRAVAGTGEATIGAVDLRPRPKGRDGVGVVWVDGDGTVPARSAVQGPPGTTDPFGDPVHLQYTCGVEHVALANEDDILDGYAGWLDHGAVPAALRRKPCPFSAYEVTFTPGTMGREDPGVGRAASAAMTLSQAEAAGRAQVVEGGGRVRVLLDRRSSVPLRLTLRKAVFTSRALPSGPTVTYGPVSGTVQIAPGAKGSAPAVTAGGRRIAPRHRSRGRSGGKLRFAAKPRWAGKAIVARVAAPAAGTLVSTVRIAGVKVMSKRAKAPRRGVVKVRVPLPVRLTVPVTLAVTFRPASGKRQVVSAVLAP